MKKRSLKTLALNKRSISNLHKAVGGLNVPLEPDTTFTPLTSDLTTTIQPITTGNPIDTVDTGVGSGSQNNSKCGYSCDPNLCGSVEPWGC